MLIKFVTFVSAIFCIKVSYFSLLQQCKRIKENEEKITKVDQKVYTSELKGII